MIKVPGDGGDRLSRRTELTQAFEPQTPTKTPTSGGSPDFLVVRGTGLVPAQMPGNSGTSSGIVTVPTGVLKGQGGSLFAAVATVDYEVGFGLPPGTGYVMAATGAGARFWRYVPESGSGGATPVGLSVEFSLPNKPTLVDSTPFTEVRLSASVSGSASGSLEVHYWDGAAYVSGGISLSLTGARNTTAWTAIPAALVGDLWMNIILSGGSPNVGGISLQFR